MKFSNLIYEKKKKKIVIAFSNKDKNIKWILDI